MSRRQGRQGLWIRYETFTPSGVVTAPKLTEDAVIFPELWQREQLDQVNPKKGPGGPLMKRMFGSVTWEIREDEAADTVQSPNFEVLVFAASTEEPAATAAADFGANLERQRVLHYSNKGVDDTMVVLQADSTHPLRWYSTITFDIKVAARLSGQDIVIMTRCSETETVSVEIRPRLQVSAYLTTP